VSAAAVGVYLASYLAPIAALLDRDDVTDLYVNRPGEVWIETLGGGSERHLLPELDARTLDRLTRQVAAYSHQGISRAHPLLAATLPDGARIQIAAPPATRGDLMLAIRKHIATELRLEDYANAGAFARLDQGEVGQEPRDLVRKHIAHGDYVGALREAVRRRLNVLVSGGTSSGKTTLLNTLIQEIPASERLIVIEDTAELRLRHANALGLLAVRGELGEAQVDFNDLLAASLRMRPDRIILGELRGEEAYTFLRAINTGHPGSMTSVHADSPDKAVEQIALMVLQGGSTLRREDVLHYVRSSVDLCVQVSRSWGKRHVERLEIFSDE
jgi:type IV secretion system protein VirB11